jgi:hypothetical protein
MTSLIVVVEGQTEEMFVRNVLGPYLCPSGDCLVIPIQLNGIKPYGAVRKATLNAMKQHVRHLRACTTMLDLYALKKCFPGYTPPGAVADPYARTKQIEDAFGVDIADHRFIPYIQVHEFEALLFTDPSKFVISYPNAQDGVSTLSAVADEFANPEYIDNDNPPSKRIQAAVPSYDKAAAGPIIAQHIGLSVIRSKCPHFNDWLTKLESLAT